MALANGVNVSVPINTSDRTDAGSAEGATWGGFGGTWTVNQKGSGVQPMWIVAGLAVVALVMLRKKGG